MGILEDCSFCFWRTWWLCQYQWVILVIWEPESMRALHFIPLTSTSPSFLGHTKGVSPPLSPVVFTCSGSCCLPMVAPVTMSSRRLKAELSDVWALGLVSPGQIGIWEHCSADLGYTSLLPTLVACNTWALVCSSRRWQDSWWGNRGWSSNFRFRWDNLAVISS